MQNKCDNSTFPITEELDPQSGKPRLRDWHNKISYQLPEDSCVYFFPCSAVPWHAWVSRLHAGCKESPVNVTSAGSRAQPHSLRPGIKLSYTRTANRSSKWEQSSVMKRPSKAPRLRRYFLRDRKTLRFLHSSFCTRTLCGWTQVAILHSQK